MNLPSSILSPFLRLFTAWIAFCTSTAAPAEDKKPSPFQTALVSAIDFKIDDQNFGQFGVTLPVPAMRDRIVQNLADWNFLVRPAPDKAISHTLVATLGQVSHQSTPVGFSFMAGNSDPRSPEFQKADVVTIGCRLTSLINPKETVEQTAEFAAAPIVDAFEHHGGTAGGAELLIDHISTVCFNLLDDLALKEPGKPSAKPAAKPGWMPEIRIETQELPAASRKGGASENPAESGGEPRKQVIIHNQGMPVILKMGHERL